MVLLHPFTSLQPFSNRLDLRFITLDDKTASDADIRRVSGIANTASLHQKHGRDIAIVREPTERTLPADGLITDIPNLGLIIRFADCQNFVVYAPQKNVVGLIHAGWRGVVAGVIPSFFQTLKKEWGIDAKDVWVGAGPSLCKKCADFTDPAKEVPSLGQFTNGRHVDLIAAAGKQFADCGVPHDHIERMADCTRCMPEKYWTYRGGHREEVKNGYTNCFVARLK